MDEIKQKARGLLADAWLADTRDAKEADHIRSGPLNHTQRIAIAALEQALTQPLEVSGDQVVLVGYKSESGEDCSAFLTASRIGQLLALTQQRGEPVEMSPEFTDSARGAIAWVLYHHQGGSSPVGQPLRFALGMGAHEDLSDEQISNAKVYAELTGLTTAEFHAARTTPQPGAEALREYITRLNEAHALAATHSLSDYEKGWSRRGKLIADELESLLGRGG